MSTNADKSRNPSPNSRSPKMLARFLRTSFARIMSIRSSEADDGAKTKNPSDGLEEDAKRNYDDPCSPEYKVKTSENTKLVKNTFGSNKLMRLTPQNIVAQLW
jgi:hypothetical protein